ncbi:unnamed protein product [Paramecium sonneborni]|uniref:Uncharacterized protein n=1 Tax=Paramecium sonneborni TaxID=65129 RepID=A0A8S1NRK8_9CILI|nr:unnamed protein product [Paramecium sonneborni]
MKAAAPRIYKINQGEKVGMQSSSFNNIILNVHRHFLITQNQKERRQQLIHFEILNNMLNWPKIEMLKQNGCLKLISMQIFSNNRSNNNVWSNSNSRFSNEISQKVEIITNWIYINMSGSYSQTYCGIQLLCFSKQQKDHSVDTGDTFFFLGEVGRLESLMQLSILHLCQDQLISLIMLLFFKADSGNISFQRRQQNWYHQKSYQSSFT